MGEAVASSGSGNNGFTRALEYPPPNLPLDGGGREGVTRCRCERKCAYEPSYATS
ncbi:hypothetical protein GCM10010862_00240 [Devosia nitrariae]|uniref:Uncharacterized protein n=1 Tax=Devosia nitrariae TaxID=2071872 RepID=A0ABQ5VYY7_9HYPH|nr:hypothetical protein GCM10010862_00240 [Devosia nitrariae]